MARNPLASDASEGSSEHHADFAERIGANPPTLKIHSTLHERQLAEQNGRGRSGDRAGALRSVRYYHLSSSVANHHPIAPLCLRFVQRLISVVQDVFKIVAA